MKTFIASSLIVPALLVVCAGSPRAETVYYVQTPSAKVFAAASFAAPVLGELSKGYRVVLTGRQGSWLKISYLNREGYVSTVALDDHPPLTKASISPQSSVRPKLSGRARISGTTAVVAGVKGLTYEDRARLGKGEAVDYEGVEKVESFKVTPAELQKFTAGGESL
jgi:hypothetical protein